MVKMQQKTRFYYISDLHLEWLFDKRGHLMSKELEIYQAMFENTHKRLDSSYKNVLLIAGDFIPANLIHHFQDFIQNQLKPFDQIYWVLGNHDYWRKSFSRAIEITKELIASLPDIADKTFVLENDLISINEDINIWGATLWYSVPPQIQPLIADRLKDYKKCKNDDFKRIKYLDFSSRYYKSIGSMKKAIKETAINNKKLVILTHHCTSELYNLKSGYSDCYGYGTTLPDDMFGEERRDYQYADFVKAFVHGHSHIIGGYHYLNDYDIDTFMNTIGYYQDEFFPDESFVQHYHIPFFEID